MAIANLYKCELKTCKYVFKTGKEAIFINHEFTTSVPSEIEELDAEVAAGHAMIYIDKVSKIVETDNRDPLEVLKAKLRAEIKAEYAAAIGKDMGQTDKPSGIQGMANSETIAPVDQNEAGAKLMNPLAMALAAKQGK